MADLDLRPATLEDVHAIGELIRRAEAHDRVPRIYSDEELRDDLSAPYIDLARDTLLAEVDGQLVGWAHAWHPEATGGLERSDLHGEVAPEHRGQGVGRQLLGWSLDRAREQLATSTAGLAQQYIRVDSPDWLEDRHRLYRRFGLEAARWSEVLLRPLTDLPTPLDPDGVRIERWPTDRAAETLEVRNTAFADHWGTTAISEELWAELVDGHSGRPDLSFVAVEDATERIVAVCLNFAYPEDEEVTGRKDAIIAILGTLREARGRGVASALIARSLGAFAGAGFDHAALDVDSDNPTGAFQLYTALGFGPEHRYVTHTIGLD